MMLNNNGQSAKPDTNTSTPPDRASDGAPSKRTSMLRAIEHILAEIRAAIVQVIADLAKENQSFREHEVEKHVVDPIVRGMLANFRRWSQDVAVSDAEAKRSTSKAVSEVWSQRRDDREIDIADLQEELARLGYSVFVDPVGTSVDSRRHEAKERIIANKRKRIGLVAKTLRPGCVRPDGTILEKQMVAIWTAGDSIQ